MPSSILSLYVMGLLLLVERERRERREREENKAGISHLFVGAQSTEKEREGGAVRKGPKSSRNKAEGQKMRSKQIAQNNTMTC